MGRPKKEEIIEEKAEIKKDTIETLIKKEFGDNILVTGNHILAQSKVVIPVSPAIDLILGGGIAEGSYVTLTGPAKVGKSTTALHFAANAQQPQYGSREVYYLNIENRLKKRDLLGIKNLNIDKFHIIQSEPGHILHAAEYLNIAEKILNAVPKCIMIIDSYSALCCEDEMTGSMTDMQRASAAKLLAKFCRKTCNVVPVTNSIILGITHIQANVSGYGSPFSEKSGNSLLYQVDCKLKAKSSKFWKLSEQGQIIGQEVLWECTVSGLDTPPGAICTSFIRYGEGIDIIKELLIICTDLGIIKKSGSWLEFQNGERAQGFENARQIVINTPGLYDSLYIEVKKMMNL